MQISVQVTLYDLTTVCRQQGVRSVKVTSSSRSNGGYSDSTQDGSATYIVTEDEVTTYVHVQYIAYGILV